MRARPRLHPEGMFHNSTGGPSGIPVVERETCWQRRDSLRIKGESRVRVLITGGTGMAGSHLADLLLSNGHEVAITARPRSRMANIAHLFGQVAIHIVDVRSAGAVDALIRQGEYDWIFHLAAQSSVPISWAMPDDTLQTNVVGTSNVLEAVRRWSPHTVVHVAGSSEEYGRVHSHEVPIREVQPFRPLSPYAVSKIAQEHLAFQYAASYGLCTCVTRAFNHEGPRRWETSAPVSFASQIADIEAGAFPPVIRVGNLDAVRDYLDVRDVVRAYVLVVQQRIVQPVNICCGHGWTIGEVLKLLLSLSKVQITVETDASRLRPSDVPILIGDGSLLRGLADWRPEIPFEQTLEVILRERRDVRRSRAASDHGSESNLPSASA